MLIIYKFNRLMNTYYINTFSIVFWIKNYKNYKAAFKLNDYYFIMHDS